MKTIEYRVQYNGTLVSGINLTDVSTDDPTTEIVSVRARDINSGFNKALKLAQEPLGNGKRRQLHSVEFWKVV